MKCPVCDNEVEDQKIYCPYCVWEFKFDLVQLTPKEKALYDERMRIARENWQALQEYRRLEEEVLLYKKILFCTDLYSSSDYAFASALDLSERSGAELIVFHALESRHRYSGQVITEDGETWGSEEVYKKLQEKLQEYYYCRIAPEKLEDVRIAVKGGVPWIEILRFAHKEKVDLIVMGPYTIRDTRAGVDLEKPHLGETAQHVTLHAHCQVSIITSPKQRILSKEAESKRARVKKGDHDEESGDIS